MKKSIFAAAAIGLMLFGACKKTDTNNTASGNAGGTWTFKSINYQAPGCDTTVGTLVANVASGTGELAVDFYNTPSATAGTFTVIKGNNTPANASQVEVGITDVNGTYYISTGYHSPTVSATTSGGKLSVTGTGIELVNLNNPSDSASLTFTINQTD